MGSCALRLKPCKLPRPSNKSFLSYQAPIFFPQAMSTSSSTTVSLTRLPLNKSCSYALAPSFR
jgi:hypothetical protein